jgi:glycerophosphoryl diester phosphodiesterase
MHTTFFSFLAGILACQLTLATEVQGHRGARYVLPENSLPAFQYALEIGVDTIELDTGVTKDGHVVIVHDQKINPTICKLKDGRPSSKNQWISQLTLTEVKQYDCGSLVNPRFKNQTLIPNTEIPTLKELFDLVNESSLPNAKSINFNIETKSNPKFPDAQPSPEVFVKLILDLVDQYQLNGRVTLQSFDHRTLLAANAIKPNIKLVALFGDNLSDWVAPTVAAKATVVSPRHDYLTSAEVDQIHKAGLTVIPWTANRKEDWARLIEMKVDGIITDNPQPLIKMLEQEQ